ncbi:SPFH domain-containing protein [Vagococcus intermedius]|uniref:SPFH domain-containing protein n=1 Tax=Vagococcus intermedius TaxID=2991418 RepID=A0AAF0CVJ7_9ENTE|nr:SPFH domain-containing protein [Vagococcus intermedius]WEG73661.1 SPFH domain-containing protein [Vagococcus intermedius]WEG75745.1 SPFH domain-containing protein [Vagococcus intermedius]
MQEKKAFAVNGYIGLVVMIVLLIGSLSLFYQGFSIGTGTEEVKVGLVLLGVLLLIIAGLFISSLMIVAPNTSKVLTFFGNYIGTIREPGLFMTVPLTNKSTVSLKVNNFNSVKMKVNDLDGNPIEIAAVVVYRVVDTAKALFEVDYYTNFIEIQSETAIRHVATKYSYDGDDDEVSLRGNVSEISEELATELQERLSVAGVEVLEARLTHLAYSTEIASAMLQRQQAKSILKARQLIVEGAVDITQSAIERLTLNQELTLTTEQRVKLVNNLLVAIVSEKGVQPTISADQATD